MQRSNSRQKRCENKQAVERGCSDELAACKTLGMPGMPSEHTSGAQSAYQVPGAAQPARQDGHHIFSARRGPHHEGGTVQLPDKQGIIRLARDLQKRARIGAARALVVVLVPVPACSLSRRSGSATRRGRGARVRRRLHSSLRPCSFPGKDRGTRRVRPENEWWFVLAQFTELRRYGGGTTEDVPGIAKINQVTRSIECCYP